MNDNPLISVIVPVYNVEQYLPKCIESIMGQTFSDWELILVDDASTDGSLAICQSYAKKDVRIKAIIQAHGGASKARNTGIRLARGEYIAFVDSDDYVSDYYLQKLYAALIGTNATLSLCGLQCVNDNGQFIPSFFISDDIPSKVSIYEAIGKLGNNVAFGVLCNKLCKKEIFQKVQLTEGRTFEDELILHHLYGVCDSIATVPEKLYFYTIRQGSKMRCEFGIEKLDVLFAYIDRLDFLIENRFDNEIIQANHDTLMLYFKHSYLRGKRSRGYAKKLDGLHKDYVDKICNRLPKNIKAPLLKLFARAPITYCLLITVINKLKIHR